MGDLVEWELYVTSHPSQLSLAILPWVGKMSTGQRVVKPCGWGVKAEMVRVWWQVKLSRVSSEYFEPSCDKALYKYSVHFFYFIYLITYLLVPCVNQLVSHHRCLCSTRCLTLVLLAAKMLLRQHVAFYAASWQTLSRVAWILLDGEARPE